MKLFPESAIFQLEFDKIKKLLTEHCNSEYAKQKAEELRIHTKKEYIELELQQSNEYKLLLQQSQYFPNDYVLNIAREIKLLGITGGTLTGDEFLLIRKLAESIEKIFRWFDKEKRVAYPALAKVIAKLTVKLVLPSPGSALVIMIVCLGAPLLPNMTAERTPRIDSAYSSSPPGSPRGSSRPQITRPSRRSKTLYGLRRCLSSHLGYPDSDAFQCLGTRTCRLESFLRRSPRRHAHRYPGCSSP